jgi:hypothetical protein
MGTNLSAKGRFGVTRTALAAPDGPDEPTPEELSHGFSLAMTTAITSLHYCRDSEPVKRIFGPIEVSDLILQAPPGIGKTGLIIEAMKMIEAQGKPRTSANRLWYSRMSPQRLAGFAMFIAGRERASLGDEWRSHLSGETGSALSPDRQVSEALGFLCAAVRYRVQDAADFAWRPVDAVLTSQGLSNLFVLLATLSISVLFIRQGSLNGLADNLGSVAVVWGAAFGLIHVGRQWRDVKPPERKPRESGR